MKRLATRFHECVNEKNCTLIRYDIIVGLQQLYAATDDESVQRLAQVLIDKEDDPKYRKKYRSALNSAPMTSAPEDALPAPM
jgi:hypothetical protein